MIKFFSYRFYILANLASMTFTTSRNSDCAFSDEELILDEILSTDTDSLPPIEALLRIARWKKALTGK